MAEERVQPQPCCNRRNLDREKDAVIARINALTSDDGNIMEQVMECRKRLSPGMNGTKHYQQRFGDRLLYVRYRHDPERQRRVTTVELIVDEGPLPPPRSTLDKRLFPHPNQSVYIRIDYAEAALRSKAKAAGAVWAAEHKRWKMPYHTAIKLGLQERIEVIAMADNGS
jgi:hypothetical protein